MRAASCCRVEVVNGGGGFLAKGLVSTDETVNRPASTAAFAASASPRLPIVSRSIFLPSSWTSRAGEALAVLFESRADRPIFLRLEDLDLALAVDDQPQRDRLHPARRLRAGKLAPQDRREREADQIIERAPRPIGVDQILIEPARLLHRLRHGGVGDGVEGHALRLPSGAPFSAEAPPGRAS